MSAVRASRTLAHLPAGRTGLSDQFLGPVAQDQPGPVGQICPTSWLSLRSDSLRPTTGQTRLFEHRSSSCVRPVNAGSDDACCQGFYDACCQGLGGGKKQQGSRKNN
ncbi:hypothetical protein PCASD_26343 [Puccinia coronata f. sp. avenae]|uniref:Uncharacterized protein n=1 Tax=Puccinia coronata f. sp. avenae TaxID=200324 RepID=A0A2N5TLC4_9BASI|nr:hypothetical protein PCASD_26343 [Puccinia coronata f. sp. avenae]